MRVLQLLGSSAGGVSQHVAQVAALLSKEDDFEVLVAAPEDLREKFHTLANFAPVAISDRPGLGDLQAMAAIKTLGSSADVVHAHGLRAGAMAGLALSTRAKAKRPRLVVTLHNLPVGGWKIQGISRALERIVANRADAVLGVSTDLVERMRSKGASVAGRALVPAPPLPQAVNETDAVRRQVMKSATSDTKLILTIARLAPQKGLDTAIAASALLRDAGIAHEWIVAGDGPLRPELEQKIAELDVPVTLLGRRSDIPELLAAADVVVNAAVWEGQPVAVQEALRAGAAIVATDVGGTRETAGEAALYVQDTNPEAMKIALTEMLTTPGVREAFQERARARSMKLPTERDVLESLAKVYRPDPRGC